jgi:acid phosphatase type 7
MTDAVIRPTVLAAAVLFAAAACSEIPTAPQPPSASTSAAALPNGSTPISLTQWLRFNGGSSHRRMLVGAGDIARCYPGRHFEQYQFPGPSNGAYQTASLLDRIPGTVMAVGDNAYEFGSPLDYLGCYHPTWGRHRNRTRPATGNHEYLTPGALGFFAYFGLRAAPPLGYYSYDLGSWHVVVINSTPQVYLCGARDDDLTLPGFPQPPPPPSGPVCGDLAQQAWLELDLTRNRRKCTVAYFHHPRFSTGRHGDHPQMEPIWDILYRHKVDVVVSAHDHLYERFDPQDPDGNATDDGIRQFTVGTGGAELYTQETQTESETRERRMHDTWGVLALALKGGRYSWGFVAVDQTVRDHGEGYCH